MGRSKATPRKATSSSAADGNGNDRDERSPRRQRQRQRQDDSSSSSGDNTDDSCRRRKSVAENEEDGDCPSSPAPAALQQKRRMPGDGASAGDDDDDSDSDVVAVHRRVLRRLFASRRNDDDDDDDDEDAATTEQRELLDRLRRRRASASAELAALRSSAASATATRTLGYLWDRRRLASLEAEHRPYLVPSSQLYRRKRQRQCGGGGGGGGDDYDDDAVASVVDGNSKTKKSPSATTTTTTSTTGGTVSLSTRMRRIRNDLKLGAAYRVAGISLFQQHRNHHRDGANAGGDDEAEETVTLRLDVAVDGRYVECFHVFFELVVAEAAAAAASGNNSAGNNNSNNKNDDDDDDDEMLYLRLVQHTLPPCVPISRIFADALLSELANDGSSVYNNGTGGNTTRSSVAMIGPIVGTDDDGDHGNGASHHHQWDMDSIRAGLRNFAGTCYRACYCYAARKRSYQFLLEQQDLWSQSSMSATTKAEPTAKQRRTCAITDVSECSSSSYDQFSFRIKLPTSPTSSSVFSIDLSYADHMRMQPTKVSVTEKPDGSTSKNAPSTGAAASSQHHRKRRRRSPAGRDAQALPASAEISSSDNDDGDDIGNCNANVENGKDDAKKSKDASTYRASVDGKNLAETVTVAFQRLTVEKAIVAATTATTRARAERPA